MTALEIVRQLAAMSTPADEHAANVASGRYDRTEGPDLDDYEADLSSDRMEDDARALWRLIDEARACLAADEDGLERLRNRFQPQ